MQGYFIIQNILAFRAKSDGGGFRYMRRSPKIFVFPIHKQVSASRQNRKEVGSDIMQRPIPFRFWREALTYSALYPIANPRGELSAKTQTTDKSAVTLDILSFQIFKELSAPTDFLYQSMPRMVIVDVCLEVSRKMPDVGGQ